MHPAPSIIVFTTLSGLGFGLMAWLGIGAAKGEGWVAFAFCALAMALSGIGLLASLWHLGQPTRFLKAFTQWRSSWLSREAVLAMATFVVFGLYAAAWIFLGARTLALGIPATALAIATVIATAMIYTQMKSVPRWRSPTTPIVFLLAALSGGALLAGETEAGGWLLAALGLAQLTDWIVGDRRFRGVGSTVATATGLGPLGRLRLLEPPHTGANYLTREMVYVIGRTHAAKLRLIGLLLAVLLPMALAGFRDVGHLAAGAAVLSHLVGVVVLRWLFFAQAEHVVGLYYGRR